MGGGGGGGGGSAPPNQTITGSTIVIPCPRDRSRILLPFACARALYNDIQKNLRRRPLDGERRAPSQLILFIELVFLNRMSFFVHEYN